MLWYLYLSLQDKGQVFFIYFFIHQCPTVRHTGLLLSGASFTAKCATAEVALNNPVTSTTQHACLDGQHTLCIYLSTVTGTCLLAWRTNSHTCEQTRCNASRACGCLFWSVSASSWMLSLQRGNIQPKATTHALKPSSLQHLQSLYQLSDTFACKKGIWDRQSVPDGMVEWHFEFESHVAFLCSCLSDTLCRDHQGSQGTDLHTEAPGPGGSCWECLQAQSIWDQHHLPWCKSTYTCLYSDIYPLWHFLCALLVLFAECSECQHETIQPIMGTRRNQVSGIGAFWHQ